MAGAVDPCVDTPAAESRAHGAGRPRSSLSPTVPQVPRNLTAADARTTKPWPQQGCDQGFFSGGVGFEPTTFELLADTARLSATDHHTPSVHLSTTDTGTALRAGDHG